VGEATHLRLRYAYGSPAAVSRSIGRTLVAPDFTDAWIGLLPRRKKSAGFMIGLTARCDQPSKVVVTGPLLARCVRGRGVHGEEHVTALYL
jgi:hypothetical protein